MKNNFKVGDLYEYKFGGIYQMIIDIQDYPDLRFSQVKKIVTQQIGGTRNGTVSEYSSQTFGMRYKKVR